MEPKPPVVVAREHQNETHTIRLYFDQVGLRVDLTISKSKSNGPSVEAAYQKVVERKGEEAARQIRAALEVVEKDPAKQAVILLKTVGGA